MNIKIKKMFPEAKLPERAHDSDAGYDLFSTEDNYLRPLERKVIKTGIGVRIPKGYYGRVAPRSGLAVKQGLDVLAGVIDSGYTGEVGVVLINLSREVAHIIEGSKVAQLIIEKCHPIEWEETDDLSPTERGEDGYGSSDQVQDLSCKKPVDLSSNGSFKLE
jgi:dUTP pyrophosphatase